MRNGIRETWSVRVAAMLAACLSLCVVGGCSVEQFAIDKLGDALSGGGDTFASDDDPELVRGALPFTLKLMESLLAQSPRHEGLLLATCSGFTQYGYAFVQQDADEIEPVSLERANALRARAVRLYIRARDYGLRGLDVRHAGFTQRLRSEPRKAVREATAADVPLLYWTAAAWGSAISLSKDKPGTVAEQPLMEALIDRAAELNPDYEHGAIDAFLIAYEPARQGAKGDPLVRSRKHFERAMQLSDGKLAGPLVSMAETVSVAKQNKAEFTALLNKALAIDPDADHPSRLLNLVMQRRARMLLARTSDLFLE